MRKSSSGFFCASAKGIGGMARGRFSTAPQPRRRSGDAAARARRGNADAAQFRAVASGANLLVNHLARGGGLSGGASSSWAMVTDQGSSLELM